MNIIYNKKAYMYTRIYVYMYANSVNGVYNGTLADMVRAFELTYPSVSRIVKVLVSEKYLTKVGKNYLVSDFKNDFLSIFNQKSLDTVLNKDDDYRGVGGSVTLSGTDKREAITKLDVKKVYHNGLQSSTAIAEQPIDGLKASSVQNLEQKIAKKPDFNHFLKTVTADIDDKAILQAKFEKEKQAEIEAYNDRLNAFKHNHAVADILNKYKQNPRPLNSDIYSVFGNKLADVASAISNGKTYFFTGSPGNGKTTSAIAIGYKALKKGYSVQYAKALDIYSNADYNKADLLIIDEFHAILTNYGSVDNPNLAQYNALHSLLEYRYLNNKSTIFISNLNKAELSNKMRPELIDRALHSGVTTINFMAKSMRGVA